MEEDNKKKKINVILFLIILFLIVSVSSSIVCYIIGRSANIYTGGRIIDTVIIEEPQNINHLPLYLTGKIHYISEIPYKGTVILNNSEELHINEEGIFLFRNLAYGKQVITIMNSAGNIVNEIPITLKQSTTINKIAIREKNNEYEIVIGKNTSLIEINIEVDEENSKIKVDVNNITTANYDGNVITPIKVESAIESTVITVNGNSIIPEGLIVLPGFGVILANGSFISKTGAITYSRDVTKLPKEISVLEDGTIVLSDSVTIETNGTITRIENPTPENPTPENPTPENSIPENPIPEEPAPKDPVPEDPVPEDPIDEKKTNGSTKKPSNWIVPIVSQEDNNWEELTTIDLFKNNNSDIEGKIYPGVSGNYSFNIENKNTYNVKFSIEMTEEQHEAGKILLKYRLKYYNSIEDKYIYVIGNKDTYLSTTELSRTNPVTLTANTAVPYILEWIWPSENGNDLQDGMIGSNENRTHMVKMKIIIEQA